MSYTTPPPQVQQSLDARDYRVRIVVAGSRGYANLREFHEAVCAYLENFDEPVLFISGAAPSGADALILRWCLRFGYPCLAMPADWSAHPRSAGFVRNDEMNRLATHVLAFHDGSSRGTQHMIDIATSAHHPVKVVRIQGAAL